MVLLLLSKIFLSFYLCSNINWLLVILLSKEILTERSVNCNECHRKSVFGRKTFNIITEVDFFVFIKMGCVSSCLADCNRRMRNYQQPPNKKDVVFDCFNPKHPKGAKITFLEDEEGLGKINCEACDAKLPFILFAHGFGSSPDRVETSESFREHFKNYNMIFVDWSDLAFPGCKVIHFFSGFFQ